MQSPARRAIVVGMDGASMEIVQNMVKGGHAPNIGSLMKKGAWCPMVGVFPTLTPPGWTALFIEEGCILCISHLIFVDVEAVVRHVHHLACAIAA